MQVLEQGVARGRADESILVVEFGPRRVDRFWIRFAMEGFQRLSLASGLGLLRCAGLDRRGRFLTGVAHAIEAGLHPASADGEIHRAVAGMDDGIGERQGRAGKEFLLGRDVG